jgi:hypothetical protein
VLISQFRLVDKSAPGVVRTLQKRWMEFQEQGTLAISCKGAAIESTDQKRLVRKTSQSLFKGDEHEWL